MTAVTVYVPAIEESQAGPVTLAARRLPTEPVAVTLVDNGKPKARELLEGIAAGLKERIPVGSVEVVSKESAGKALDEKQAREVAARSDLVITGLGDCGACSSMSLHDAVQMEVLGVPATVVITDAFQALIANQSRNLGAPGYHNVVVPHPVSSKDAEHVQRLASSVVDAVLRQLTE